MVFGLPANVPPFFTLTKCDADFDRKKDGVTRYCRTSNRSDVRTPAAAA